jgi:hypothetical protein
LRDIRSDLERGREKVAKKGRHIDREKGRERRNKEGDLFI